MLSLARPFALLSICLFVYLFIFISPAFASGEFSTSFRSLYTIDNDVMTTVHHQISLTNQKANAFASEYSLTIGSTAVSHVQVFDEKGSLPFTSDSSENSTTISAQLSERPVVGIGGIKTFTIQYQDRDIASFVGKVLEVNIPRIANADEFTGYETRLTVPKKFGAPSTIAPDPESTVITNNGHVLTFHNHADTGISAVFGTSQLFTFTLAYYLENKGLRQQTTLITLPPDTAFQRMRYDHINPKPLTVRRDTDGNWIAAYRLEGNEQLKISVSGTVEVFMTPTVPIGTPDDVTRYLSPTQYWPSEDPEIIAIAKDLKTPKAVYDYVASRLSYDYSKVELGANREGGRAALMNPSKSICTEFTDLFITLARASGIPARELNGYAYTNNPKLRPLSLGRDILHAWPEYWSDEKKQWIPVDPTWANTTGGIDYFTKLDFNHIVFAIHGISATEPLSAGFYKTSDDQAKTVFVDPATSEPEQMPSALSAVISGPAFIPSLFGSTARLEIQNHGPEALYNIVSNLRASPAVTVSNIPPTIPYLLPGEHTENTFHISPQFVWRGQKTRITATIGETETGYEPVITSPIISYQVGAVILALAFLLSLIAAARTGHLHLPRRK